MLSVIIRFPYRLIPKLPPAKLLANVVGVSSDFIDERRKGLVRWLTIVTSHPVIKADTMIRQEHFTSFNSVGVKIYLIRIFLTDNRTDQAGYLRDQFRHFPDEFVLSNIGYKVTTTAITIKYFNTTTWRAKKELVAWSILTHFFA